MTRIDDLKVGDLLIRVDRSAPGCLRLDWLGPCDNRNPVELVAPFFEHVLAESCEHGLGVDLHFEALAYFNSSCIAALVRLVRLARDSKVALRFYYDAQQKWQALTFELLERALSSPEDLRAGSTVQFLPGRR